MPRDEKNINNNKNQNRTNPSGNTSLGRERLDDGLLKHVASGAKEAFNNSSPDDGKYKARGSNGGSSKKSGLNLFNPTSSLGDKANTVLETSKPVRKVAEKVPGKVGEVAKVANRVADVASKTLNRNKNDKETPEGIKKNRENRFKNPFNPLGILGFGDHSDSKDSKKSDDEKKEDNNLTTNLADKFANSFKGRIIKISIILAIPLTMFVVIFVIFFFTGDVVSAHKNNFISSTIRGEELIGSMTYDKSNSTSQEEKDYIANLSDIYTDNNQFNPDLVSSTFQVMMNYEQYSENGRFNYVDINNGCNNFSKKINLFGKCKIKELADSLKGSQISSGNVTGGGSNVSVEGVVDVASDADKVNPPFDRNPANIVETGRTALDGISCRLTAETWAAFQVMEQAAAADGISIGVNDCYRTYEEQQAIIDSGTGIAPAAPGQSDHHLGSTVDIANHDAGTIHLAEVENWLVANGPKYGFIQRYKNWAAESHHFRFVGSKMAQAYVAQDQDYATFVTSQAGQDIINSRTGKSTSSSVSSSSSSNKSSSGGSQADDVARIATAELGNGRDANGVTKYGQWYGDPTGDWCAMFASWVLNQAGLSEEAAPKFGLPSVGKQWFIDKGRYHDASDTSYQPQVGDIVFYQHSHVGIVVENNNGNLKTVEGNSGLSYNVYMWEDPVGQGRFASVAGYGTPVYSGSSVSSSSSSSSGNVKNYKNYKKQIKEFIMKYLPKATDKRADDMVEEIFDYLDDYYDLIGKKFVDCGTTTTSSAGSCTYNVQGVGEVSNLKVRLMNCSGSLSPVEGEELVDFEKYVLGVTYAEIGGGAPTEAVKAQAIAARSYALTRRKPVQEDGQWILEMKGCTMDQVYCDPDKGCHQTSGVDSLVRSGPSSNGSYHKSPIAEDDPYRTAVNETSGQVLVNDKGEILNTGYVSTIQDKWTSWAKSGKDVTQILIEHYAGNGASRIENSPCNGQSKSSASSDCPNNSAGKAASGDYVNWRQFDDRWGSESLGSSDIATIGCTATSMAMLIAKSGVPTIVTEDFNPGSFVRAMKANGGFDGGGNYNWGVTSKVVPSYQDGGFVNASLSSLPSEAQRLISQGYYGVAWVGRKGYCHHWVAIDRVDNGKLYIIDPAWEGTDLTERYNVGCGIHYFKLG